MSQIKKKLPRREEIVPAAKTNRIAVNAHSYATPARSTAEMRVINTRRLAGMFTKDPGIFCVESAEVDEGAEFSFELLSSSIVPVRQPEMRSKSPFSRVK